MPLNFNFLFRLKFKNNPSQRGEPIIFLLLRIFLVIFLIDAGLDNVRQQNRNAHVFATGLHQDDEYFTKYLWNSTHGGFNIVGLLNAHLLESKEPQKVKVLSFRPSDPHIMVSISKLPIPTLNWYQHFYLQPCLNYSKSYQISKLLTLLYLATKWGRLKKLVSKTFLTIPNMPLWFLKCMIIAFIEFKERRK